MTKSILFCYAHPDDEVGIIALANRYMREEQAITTLICTTNGDVGTIDPIYMEGYSSITERRLAEFACATQAAGFTNVVTFDYRDSGMMGAPDNEHPNSSWQVPLEVMTQRVIAVMHEVHPQVVVTFNTFGAYGHPDHIKINQATVAAFQQLQGEPDAPQKLYYATMPTQLLRFGIAVMRLRGKDPRKGGRNNDMDFVASLAASSPITTKIATLKYIEPAWKAMECYASQMQLSPMVRRLRSVLGPLVQGKVALSRVYPEVQRGAKMEHDIFANVNFPVTAQAVEAGE
jgi:N-acetyl-1-D-myo-inositol-2-amino-2-deoxy-alpha-D-glucopyranoside deacetylase